jgi:DNA mismatch endonuclease (patch repair protein)
MGRPPASSYNALKTMQANRRVSGLEMRFRRALWAAGVRGYRVHRRLPGRPDLVFGRPRLAVFVHGCWWHQPCPREHAFKPKANAAFWEEKFRQNRRRDLAAVDRLQAMGWSVMTIWECDLRTDTPAAVELVRRAVSS